MKTKPSSKKEKLKEFKNYPLWLKLGAVSTLLTLLFLSPTLPMKIVLNPIRYALILLATIIASFIPGAILGLFIEQLSRKRT